MNPGRPPIKGLRFAADRDARRRAFELRAAAFTAGVTMLLAGIVASVDIFMRGAIEPAWSLLIVFGSVAVCWRSLNVSRLVLRRDSSVTSSCSG
jgi:hypothetical protein